MPTVVTEEFHDGASRRRAYVPSGTTTDWLEVPKAGASVVAVPGAGASMTVQLTHSLPSMVKNGTAVPIDWPAGSVDQTTAATLSRATAVRFVAVGGDGYGEIAQ